MAKLRQQRIRAKLKTSHADGDARLKLGGWLSGRNRYLRLAEDDGTKPGVFRGMLDGQKLYRLAKAIVRHYENDI